MNTLRDILSLCIILSALATMTSCGGSGSAKPSEESLYQAICDNLGDYWKEYDAISEYEKYYPDGKYAGFIDSLRERTLRTEISEYFDKPDTTAFLKFPKEAFKRYIENYGDNQFAPLLFNRYDSVWNAAISSYRTSAASANPQARDAMINLMEYMRDNRLQTIYITLDIQGECRKFSKEEEEDILKAYHSPLKTLLTPSNSSFKKTEAERSYFLGAIREQIFFNHLPKRFVTFEERNKYGRYDSICPLIHFQGTVKDQMTRVGGKELPKLWVIDDNEGNQYTAMGFCMVGIEVAGDLSISFPFDDIRYTAQFVSTPNKDNISAKYQEYRSEAYNSMFHSCLSGVENSIYKCFGVRPE